MGKLTGTIAIVFSFALVSFMFGLGYGLALAVFLLAVLHRSRGDTKYFVVAGVLIIALSVVVTFLAWLAVSS